MNRIEEEDVLALRLAEQEILRQSLEEKNERLKVQEAEIEYLKGLLNGFALAPRVAVQPAAKTLKREVPRRWAV